jgi:lysophospholipase L1-like esterase
MVTERSYPKEAADPYCLREGEAERLLAGHPWHRFAVLGDSIAAGVGESQPGYADEPWCDRIAAALRVGQPGLEYLNLGTENTPAARVRQTQLPGALNFAPGLALVSCGGWDLLQPVYHPAAVSAEIRAIVSALVSAGATVVTVGLFDGSYSPAVLERFSKPLQNRLQGRLRDLARSTREVAEDLGTVHIDMTWHPAAKDPDLYSSDGRHGSMRGHAISAAEVIRALGAELAKRGQRHGSRPRVGDRG